MTNILTVLPDFDTKPYSHILPSLEKALISAADLLSLDAIDVAKRAQVPTGEVKRLTDALLDSLHGQPGRGSEPNAVQSNALNGGIVFTKGEALAEQCETISTLDDTLDDRLGGGIPRGYLTEITGESAVGKTQFLLTLLLSAQLADQGRDARTVLYISTEAPIQTIRLSQILKHHPKLSGLDVNDKPSLSRIQSTHIHDLEAQEHILQYQVPAAIQRLNVGLLVVDSIAANYRAEFDRGKANKGAEAFAKRSAQMAQLGAHLRSLARSHNIAVVVANQVADRFAVFEPTALLPLQSQSTSRSGPASPRMSAYDDTVQFSQEDASFPTLSTDDPLALDHQQRFFTGWGDEPEQLHLKTPSLGLTWTNQLSSRIALLKEPIYEDKAYAVGEDRNIVGWDRKLKVVFSSWCASSVTRFEIGEGGVSSALTEDGG